MGAPQISRHGQYAVFFIYEICVQKDAPERKRMANTKIHN